MSEFIWTEQDVRDILQGLNKHVHSAEIDRYIREYKASKQPKPEWEILYNEKEGSLHPYQPHKCNDGTCSIYKVKRLSDGEVFTVGDEAHSPEGGKEFIRPITEFTIEGNDIRVHFREFGRLLQHVKKPLCPVLLTPSEIEKLKQLLNA